ncbi:hypothetical protein C1H46_000424 [Malus baccata]|uniref:XPG-I domain-containing protein n=1 Tax=Malus baccata TaxID=106549 RepID=A0A540NSI8_MALBA|nr:hypothetical protein C1H46_000424 [Malus baccata]
MTDICGYLLDGKESILVATCTVSHFCLFFVLVKISVITLNDIGPWLLTGKAGVRIFGFLHASLEALSDQDLVEHGEIIATVPGKADANLKEQLKFLGMPILKAKGEIEALCAQLNGDNHVDVCITFDSDAYLFEAKCVIKTFRSNSKEPFEWYYMSDIEAGLGLKRNHLIAPSLLAENDHDLNGVQWLDTTLCFGQTFSEDEINSVYFRVV